MVALSWIRSPVCTLSEEEHAAIEPFRGGSLRLLRDGQMPTSSDDDVEFFLETGVDKDSGSGHG
jgi:hypothetical protein